MKAFFLNTTLALICVLSALIAGCTKDNTPLPTPLSAITPAEIQVKTLWNRAITNGTDSENLTLNSALQGSTLVTVGYHGDVVALDADNGNMIWHNNIDHSISATPGVNSTMVFVGTKDGYLVALDLKTGKILWQTPLPTLILGAPAATDDVVAVLCHDSTVAVLSTQTGKILWSYQATSPSLTLYGNSSPLINNGVVYVGFDSGQLGAFDLYQGSETWQVPIAIEASTEAVQNLVDIDGTPVLDSNVLFATSYHGTLSAINPANGAIIWQRNNSSFEAPVVQNNQVIVVDETGQITAFDESTGNTLWQQKNLLYRFISSPTIINNEVVVGDFGGFVHFISLTDGHVMARIQVSGKGISAAPLVYNNEVIVTTNDGRVVALQPSQ